MSQEEIKIPEGWELKPLDKISLVERGMSWSKSEESKTISQTSIPVLRIGNVRQLRLDLENLIHIENQDAKKILKNKVSKNDILIVGSNGNRKLVGRSCKIEKDMDFVYASFLMGVKKISDEIDPDFLLYYLNSSMGLGYIQKSTSSGVGINNLKISDLRNMPVVFPKNKTIQKKIVQKLDHILGKLEEKKTEILSTKPFDNSKKLSLSSIAYLINLGFSGKLTENWRKQNKNISSHELIKITFPNCYEEILKNSLKLTSQFELKGIDIPQEWIWVTIDDLFNVVMGQSPPGSSYNKIKKGTPLLNGPTEFTEIHPIPTKFTNKPTKICKKNDLLICVRGNTTGKMNWADQSYCIGRGLAAINPKNSDFNIDLLYYFLNQKTSEILLRTAGSTFPNLSQDKLKSFPYPLAPIQEQLQILKEIKHKISEYNKISKLLYSVEEKRKHYSIHLDSIQNSVLNSAFSGKLVN